MSNGSSPRVWGTRTISPRKPVHRRFIPTGVGNTSSRGSGIPGQPVHPHGCGEHYAQVFNECRLIGSSPRVWGTQDDEDSITGIRRFIPTGVGNTLSYPAMSDARTVHPHGCGEHILCNFSALFALGSSPRVWGTRPADECAHDENRFIPTGVGNTEELPLVDRIIQVHPHGCGEHAI